MLLDNKVLFRFLGIVFVSIFFPIGITAADEEESVTIEEITDTAQKR